MPDLGDRIKRLRLNAGKTVEQAVARAGGITVSMWYKIESGDRNPSLETLRKVADGIGCSVPDLFLPSTCTMSASQDQATARSA